MPIDYMYIFDLREALWLLGSLHPKHRWNRRSGCPRKQLERFHYSPSPEVRDRGFRALTSQGKTIYKKWAIREGLPLPEQPRKQSIVDRYGPPRLR